MRIGKFQYSDQGVERPARAGMQSAPGQGIAPAVARPLAGANDQAALTPSIPKRRMGWTGGLLLSVLLLVSGCLTPQRPIARPTRHSIRAEQLLVLSDFKIEQGHPLIEDLALLRNQVSQTLALPEQKEEVVVYLFSTEEEYRKYLDAAFPGLPRRRAYFVGTPHELAVYTYWGERIQGDLRHEYTHGLLHACLKNVPLWIDEGLAEYFEVIGPAPGMANTDYAQRLSTSLANGWRPDLVRLERINEFSQMQRIDYQESWAWVHYMLHTTPEAKEALLTYLSDLQQSTSPPPLSRRLGQLDPHVEARFLSYLASLNTMPMWDGPKAAQKVGLASGNAQVRGE